MRSYQNGNTWELAIECRHYYVQGRYLPYLARPRFRITRSLLTLVRLGRHLRMQLMFFPMIDFPITIE
jgi:hypothetical protein